MRSPQAERAAPQARRREGLTPHGRDAIGGMGRSPKARRRIAPTRQATHAMTTCSEDPSGYTVGLFPLRSRPRALA
ncbi:TPA: hypothetical protein SJ425_001800 [Yersinia enterocolitica]|nr:hypothetical protein [Yersinia mollaretii]ELI8091624.1 hypothetical protein [Yersinia enterocolitica]HDL6742019.1 hypothetical protein [Yersinia enterocolitica]HDL7105828.1 hypothetical protein [Yersinia enterocolitica]HDL7145086.1 hypothetical protein [Yersinia enterocolitica]HDL7413148.1 hypothetical protein [Yersinia enterocolitica]